MPLTEEQLNEVDRIIRETPIETSWDYDGESSFQVDDATETLVEVARRIRTYLTTLK